jgi:dienelactone hydrolase
VSGDAPTEATGQVTRLTLALVDRSRPTPANGDFPGAPERTLETVVSYTPPDDGGGREAARPLVVFATGYGGTSTNWSGLYDPWVRAGYVVAAPTFPLSRRDAPGGTTGADYASQPGDVRFVTEEVLRLARTNGSPLDVVVAIDEERVALAGKSFGAITVLDAGYNPDERVAGIRAVLALTGVASAGVRFESAGTPLFLAHGDADDVVSISGSEDAFRRAQPPKFFLTLFGADHMDAFGGGDSGTQVAVARSTTAFLDHFLGEDADALDVLCHACAVDGVASMQAAPA